MERACKICHQILEPYDDNGLLFQCINPQCPLWVMRLGLEWEILLRDNIADIKAKEIIAKNSNLAVK